MLTSTRWIRVCWMAILLLAAGTTALSAQAPGGGGGGGGGGRAPMTPLAYRQGIMQELQTNMGALNAVRMGQAGAASHAVARATILQQLASMLPEAFPEGSATGTSRALAAIWTSSAEFGQRVQALQTATAALVEAARAGNDAGIASAQMAVQGACAACHMQFRGPAQ